MNCTNGQQVQNVAFEADYPATGLQFPQMSSLRPLREIFTRSHSVWREISRFFIGTDLHKEFSSSFPPPLTS